MKIEVTQEHIDKGKLAVKQACENKNYYLRIISRSDKKDNLV